MAPPAPDPTLAPARFVDSTHPSIQALARDLTRGLDRPEERAAAVFGFVRDRVPYVFDGPHVEDDFVASRVLAKGRGFCVQKAVLLAALGRACAVPSALVLCDLLDHTLPEKLVRELGTNVMFHHGVVAFFLGGRWVKVDATLERDLLERKGCRVVGFDGTGDALLASTTLSGRPHAEYLRWHGSYADLPYDQMVAAFRAGYPEVAPRQAAPNRMADGP